MASETPRALRFIAAACLALPCVLAVPTLAHAQKAPTAAEKESARSLMKSGDEAYEAGDFDKALKDYEAADAIMGVPVTRAALGRAQEKLGLLVEARDTFLSIRRIPKRAREPRPFLVARSEAESIAQKIAGRIPEVIIEIQGVPEGKDVAVTIDGVDVPAALIGRPRKTNPGDHIVVAVSEGSRGEKKISLPEGAKETVTLKLDVSADAGAGDAVPAGDDAASDGMPGDEGTDDGGLSIPIWSWVGWGVGAAGLIAGGVTGGLALSTKGDIDGSCTDNQCPRAETESDLDTAKLLADISTATFIVGGVGVAFGTIALFVFPSDDDDDEDDVTAISVTPQIGPGYVGLTGTF